MTELPFLKKKREVKSKKEGKTKKKQLSREDSSFILGIKEPIKETKSADTKPE